MQHQAQLVGGSAAELGTVGGQVRVPGFDVVLGLAALAVMLFIQRAGAATGEVGDDKARVGALGAGLNAGGDALQAAATGGTAEELLVATQLALGAGRSMAATGRPSSSNTTMGWKPYSS